MKIMIVTLALLLSSSAFAQTVSDSVQLGTQPAAL
jgi:hypothetical protein